MYTWYNVTRIGIGAITANYPYILLVFVFLILFIHENYDTYKYVANNTAEKWKVM